MDGYTKQKYHEAIDRAVTKTTNSLIDDGKIDKNTIVGVKVEISFLIDKYIQDCFTVNGVVEKKPKDENRWR